MRVFVPACTVNVVLVSENPPVSSVPLMRDSPAPRVSASCIAQVPPTPLQVRPSKGVLPAEVIVWELVDVSVSVKSPPEAVIPATNRIDPAQVSAPLGPRARVPVKPVQVRFLQFTTTSVMVTVTAPDAASRNTSSADVGMASPPAPPEVSDHLVPAVSSQLAVPPTQ